jgi:hypothetical protein
MGEWDAARAGFEIGLTSAREVGEKRVELDCLSFMRSMSILQGRFQDLPAMTDEHFEVALASNDLQHGYHCRTARGELALRRLDIDDAHRWLLDARDRLTEAFPSDRLLTLAPLAAVNAHQGNLDESWQITSDLIRSVGKAPPVGYYTVEPFWHLNAVLHNMIAKETLPKGVSHGEVAALAKVALDGALKLGASFPAAAPRAAVLDARAARLMGKESVAADKARQAAELAAAMSTPMELAMAKAELGRNMTLSGEERSALRAEAERIYIGIGLPELGAMVGDDIAPIHG